MLKEGTLEFTDVEVELTDGEIHYQELKDIIGNWVQVLRLPKGAFDINIPKERNIAIVCDEDGALLQRPTVLMLWDVNDKVDWKTWADSKGIMRIRGTMAFAAVEDNKLVGLTEEEIEELRWVCSDNCTYENLDTKESYLAKRVNL